MQIECKLKRHGGSKIDVGGTTYHFKPANPNDPNSPHLCDVKDKNHAQRFLGISEGYCLPGDAPAQKPAAPVAPPPSPTDQTVASTEQAPADPATAPVVASTEPSEQVPLEAKSDDELREIIKEATGRYPHPNTSREKLIAKIRGEDDGE